MSSKSPKQPPDKKVQVTKHTRRRKISEPGMSITDSKNAKKLLRHNKEVLDTLNSLVARDAAVSTTEEETLITFTGFCWRCHSTEHKESKCPNANDDKYDGNYEKNRMRYHELKAIEMKKEKKCSRCNTKEKLSGFFLRDWYKDECERVCKDCRKLEVKMCNMCNTWKKRHSFKEEQWDRKDESKYRLCNHCVSI